MRFNFFLLVFFISFLLFGEEDYIKKAKKEYEKGIKSFNEEKYNDAFNYFNLANQYAGTKRWSDFSPCYYLIIVSAYLNRCRTASIAYSCWKNLKEGGDEKTIEGVLKEKCPELLQSVFPSKPCSVENPKIFAPLVSVDKKDVFLNDEVKFQFKPVSEDWDNFLIVATDPDKEREETVLKSTSFSKKFKKEGNYLVQVFQCKGKEKSSPSKIEIKVETKDVVILNPSPNENLCSSFLLKWRSMKEPQKWSLIVKKENSKMELPLNVLKENDYYQSVIDIECQSYPCKAEIQIVGDGNVLSEIQPIIISFSAPEITEVKRENMKDFAKISWKRSGTDIDSYKMYLNDVYVRDILGTKNETEIPFSNEPLNLKLLPCKSSLCCVPVELKAETVIKPKIEYDSSNNVLVCKIDKSFPFFQFKSIEENPSESLSWQGMKMEVSKNGNYVCRGCSIKDCSDWSESIFVMPCDMTKIFAKIKNFNYREALVDLEICLKNPIPNEYKGEIYMYRGILYFFNKDEEKAKKEFEKSIELAPALVFPSRFPISTPPFIKTFYEKTANEKNKVSAEKIKL